MSVGVCLAKESFLAPLLANENGKMGLWIKLIRNIKICSNFPKLIGKPADLTRPLPGGGGGQRRRRSLSL